jgi:hypothetical protein
MPDTAAGGGYAVTPDELNGLVKALGGVAEAISDLVSSADQLGQRLPLLGTAPPALALADRLRAAAGEAGLTGELGAAGTELREYHRSLVAALADYLNLDEAISSTLDGIGGLLQ